MSTKDRLAEVWHNVFAVQPDPPLWVILVTLAAALALVIPRQVWPTTRNVVTIAHEGGHAIVALAFGRKLSGIKLHEDTSGVTISAGKPTGFGVIATTAAGYIAPALLGLAAVWLLANHHITGMLWGTLLLLAGMFVAIRNAYGAFTVGVTGAVIFIVSWWAPTVVQGGFAYLLCWFLLLAAPRPVVELQMKRRRGEATESDADQLYRLTGIPGIFWVGVFGVTVLSVLVLGVRWLLF